MWRKKEHSKVRKGQKTGEESIKPVLVDNVITNPNAFKSIKKKNNFTEQKSRFKNCTCKFWSIFL